MTATKVDRGELEDFLYFEGKLLDERRFDEWLDCFEDEALYWVPCNADDIDPAKSVSIIYDDKTRMKERVWRMGSGLAYAQDPPSRTRRIIGNVRVAGETPPTVVVESNFIIVELRHGVQTTYAGSYKHTLDLSSERPRIREKRVLLINNDEPLGNLTFFL